jgi:Na+-driven multidrug efflux pump
MGDVQALAAQGAADRVFSSAFWTISFLPALVTPLVAKAAAAKDNEAVYHFSYA